MKINSIITGIIVFTGFFATAQTQLMEKPDVMIEDQSRYGFAETISQLSGIIVEKGWKITTTHDLQATMKKNGKDVLPVSVIELCSPNHAFQILSMDQFRDVSPMLPCRISVYEKSDGKTYISRMNAPVFAGMIGGEAGKTIGQAFSETEEMVRKIIR
ncbi:MAG: DUF302 domain-containing protein [Bacteroidota bacterium]